MSRAQCALCPWKKGIDPFDIAGGYTEEAHRALSETIADPYEPLRRTPMMACHEYQRGSEKPCVGWLANQLGSGNNIPLRLRVHRGEVDGDVRTVGPQHRTFEQTLPVRK